MNENIDLTKILKNCPKGTKLYSPLFGEVKLERVEDNIFGLPIWVSDSHSQYRYFFNDGKYKSGIYTDSSISTDECMLFPSKENRDWSQWECPNPKFDPNTLKPFDKVICRNGIGMWHCDFFSSYIETYVFKYACIGNAYRYCIPYNDDTKHLVGTTAKAPEYYRYWED